MRNEIKVKSNILDHLKIIKNKKLKKIYNDRKINSIYFDTIELNFFHDSEEGTTPRKKIRYRWYGDKFNKNGNIEIKEKNTLFSQKQGIKIKINSLDNIKEKIFSEIKINLIPTLLVSYKRKYFIDNKSNRYTIDSSIFYTSLNRNFNKRFSKKVDYSILEVKKSIDNLEVNDASTFGPNITRYSKYCEGIKYTYF